MDLKGRYQEKAEELAEELHGVDFYSLPDEIQFEVYRKAEVEVHENMIAGAETLLDRQRGM